MSLYGDFSWEGAFEYNVGKVGHHWKYFWWDIDTEKGWGKFPETAQRVFPHIGAINKILTKSFPKIFPTAPKEEWKVVKWLSNQPVKVPNASRPLTLILNAVVKDATLHTFEVLSTFVEDNSTVEIKGLREGVPNWFYLNGKGASALATVGEFMLATPKHFFLDPGKKNLKGKGTLTKLIDQLSFTRALHQYSIIRFEKDSKRIKIHLKDEVTVCDYPRGRICGTIPIPGKGSKEKHKEPIGVNTPEVVVVSPVVAEALDELSRIWQDPFAKSVLISAPPGSGKEVFAHSIPYGNNRQTENLQTLSLATDDQQGLLRQLYGKEREDGSIEEGLIAKATRPAPEVSPQIKL